MPSTAALRQVPVVLERAGLHSTAVIMTVRAIPMEAKEYQASTGLTMQIADLEERLMVLTSQAPT